MVSLEATVEFSVFEDRENCRWRAVLKSARRNKSPEVLAGYDKTPLDAIVDLINKIKKEAEK